MAVTKTVTATNAQLGWSSFINMTGWNQQTSSPTSPTGSSPRSFGHFRSMSTVTSNTTTNGASPKPRRASSKPGSLSSLQFMLPSFTSPSASPPQPEQSAQIYTSTDPASPANTAPSSPAVTSPPGRPTRHRISYSQSHYPIDEEMSTIPDPRIRALASSSMRPGSAVSVDLNDEVATLSAKLINAINYQTSLDDNLAAARRELDSARGRIQELEGTVTSQRELLSGDVWVRRSTVEQENKAWHTRVNEEKRARQAVETEKRRIEYELENLTTALFEEANNMVISAKETARIEQEALQRRNDQLKAQLADNEGLLRSQQEQLTELKRVMEQMAAECDDQSNLTAPSSPGGSKFDAKDYGARGLPEGISTSPLSESVSPTYPTSYTQLLQPVLRTDIAAYDDFVNLTKASRVRSSSRVSSISGLNALGIGLGGVISNASSTSLPTTSPHAPGHAGVAPAGSTNNSPSASATAPGPTLRETKFFKRALLEDIEPTLRLEMAPGLSWLARRTVLNAICDGNLVVEPLPVIASLGPVRNSTTPVTPPQFQPCSLCGENRQDPQYLRNHRLRASESDTAQRHPLCAYCLGRVRSTGDFLGFMRMVRDGHWRTEGEDGTAAAWEESVRLREQMFWARIGGGVVPATHVVADGERSRRTSRDTGRNEDSSIVPDISTCVAEEPTSLAAPILGIADNSLRTPPGSNRNSMQFLSPTSPTSLIAGDQRLSLTIPLPPSPSISA